MAPALPDRVDCERMAADAVVITRDYALCDLPRLRGVLLRSDGRLRAKFAFGRSAVGWGASVSVVTAVRLTCQRCLQPFEFAVDGTAQIEFAAREDEIPLDSEREVYVMADGTVSLRELAEEELILALPLVAACDTPTTCGNAPAVLSDEVSRGRGESVRPFAGLQDLLKKT